MYTVAHYLARRFRADDSRLMIPDAADRRPSTRADRSVQHVAAIELQRLFGE
jgi:hypothetical protein